MRPQDLSDRFEQELAEVTAELKELERLAAAKGKRRGEHSLTSKDPQKYRLGSIFWVLAEDFNELDDLALLGLLSWGPKTLQLLAKASRAEDENLMQSITRIMADEDLRSSLRKRGGLLRWEKSRALYITEVENFATSAAARNPNGRWRRKSPSRKQIYLIAEIVRCFDISPPEICTRGEAFEWLYAVGGNPRYANPPHTGERI